MGYADGRAPQALKWLVAKSRDTATVGELRRYVGAAASALLLFSPLLVISGVVIVWFSPSMTKADPQDYVTVRLACGILAFSFAVSMFAGLPEAILRGMNLGYKRMGIQALSTFIGGGLLVAAVYSGLGLVGLGIAQLVAASITGLLFWRICARAVSWFGLAWANLKETFSFVGLSGWYLAWGLVDTLLRSSDLIVLSWLASPELVTTYVLTRFSAETCGKVMRTVLFGTLPGLGGIIGRKDYERALFLRSQMMAATWLLVVSMGSSVLVCNRSFLGLWIGSDHFGGHWVNLLTVAVSIQMSMAYNDAAIMTVALRPAKLVLWGALAGILFAALSAVLVPRAGIAGLCWALLVGRSVVSLAYPRLVLKLLGTRRGGNRVAMTRAAMVGFGLLGLGWYLGTVVHAKGWVPFLAYAAGSFLGFFVLMLLLGFGRSERDVFMTYVRKVRFSKTC
jgi:O-antigen/teichoic acid export membrane protein